MAKPFDPTAFPSLAEGPEQAAAKREADEAYEKLGFKDLDLDGAKSAMGGIGQRNPEEAKKVAGEVALAEAGEEENPDAILAELDGNPQGEGSETLVGNTGDDVLGGEKKETENNSAQDEGRKESENIGGNQKTPKDGKEGNAIVPEKKEQETPNTPDEHPESPFIERLGNAISPEMKKDWVDQLDNGKPFGDIVKQSILPDGLKKYISTSWDAMNSSSGKEKMQSDFKNDFEKECKTALGNDGEISEGDHDLISQIGKNYMKGQDETPEGKKQALDMALSTTVNNEVFGKQCDKSKMSYTKNMERIKNPNLGLKERLQALKKVKVYVNRDQGSKAENYEDIADMMESADMTLEYQEAQQALSLAQTQNNPTDIQAAQEKISSIVDEASELTGTPLGTFDTALESGKSEIPTETQKEA